MLSRSVCKILILLSVMALGCLASCSSSTTPDADTTPPEISLYLNVIRFESSCPMMVGFSIQPRGVSDDESAPEDLRVRWDFNSDGSWDTDFMEIGIFNPFEPSPLPYGTWSVTCEVVDEAGNANLHVETLELPEWLPASPDLLAGEIEIHPSDNPLFAVDTLRVGEPFGVMLSRSEWVESDTLAVRQRYYIDGELVTQSIGQVSGPIPGLCSSSGHSNFTGFVAAGLHEIKIEIEFLGSIVESDLSNNSTTREVVVIE